MRIGLALPHYDYSFPSGEPLSWPALLDAARRAEAFGFGSAWISDHFFTDISRYGGPVGLLGTVEPFTALAALAAATSRIRLGTLVACAPFRHPAHVAKMATAIDLVSGGRFDLGIGAGWYEAEFGAFGFDFGSVGERFSVLEESVEVVSRLFREGPVDFDGAHYRLAGAYNRPRPAQAGGPPIWIGGKGGPRQFRLVARHGAGWNSVWRWSPEAFGDRVAELRRVAEAEGRDPSTVRVSVGLYALVGENEQDLGARFRALQAWTPGGGIDGVTLQAYASDTLTGTVEACLERLGRFASFGVEEVVVSAATLPFAVYDWSMVELIAERLIPAARGL
jgi:probable F420-dependent oxidoreductase